LSLFTREQRKQLGKLEVLRVAGEGECPVGKGDEIPITSTVTFRVDRVNVRRGGGWSLGYTLLVRDEKVRNLKRVPRAQDFDAIRKSFDSAGYPQEPTRDVLEEAAEESAYTSRPTSLADAGEAVDRVTQRRFSEEAKMADRLRDQRRREKYERRNTLERLAEARAEAVARRVDISHHERVIEDRIDRIERLLGKDVA
jgi:hypothetical protein